MYVLDAVVLYPLVASVLVAGVSLIGIITLARKGWMRGSRRVFLPLAVGIFLGVVFFELLPETFATTQYASGALAFGFLGFYVLAHLISEYHHHHSPDCMEHRNHKSGMLVLIGDAIHNFADGIVIAIAFSLDTTAGIATTAGILLHEVPQEIAEFSVLISAGYERSKALLYNFISALSVVIGVIFALVFIELFEGMVGILIGIAAGNLLYIGASDLLPDLKEHRKEKGAVFWSQLLFVLIGLVGMKLLFGFTGV